VRVELFVCSGRRVRYELLIELTKEGKVIIKEGIEIPKKAHTQRFR
jgi:hypothetical protein